MLGKKYSDLNFSGDNSPNNNDLLETLVYLAPILQQLFSVDCFIGVTDRENFLCHLNGKNIKLPMELTGPIPEEFPHREAMRDNTCVNIVTPKDVLGYRFRTTVVPIKNRDGSVLMNIRDKSKSLKDKVMETVANSQEQLAATLEITHLTKELAVSAEQLEKSARDVIG